MTVTIAVGSCFRLLIERLQVDGDLVAMVPSRDSLLVCGTDDEQSLRIMVDLAKKANEDPRSLVPIPVRRDGDDWVDWFPAKGHPLFSDFRELAMRYFFQEYADQKELLEQLHQKDGTDIFVASNGPVLVTLLGSVAVWLARKGSRANWAGLASRRPVEGCPASANPLAAILLSLGCARVLARIPAPFANPRRTPPRTARLRARRLPDAPVAQLSSARSRFRGELQHLRSSLALASAASSWRSSSACRDNHCAN